MEYMKIWTNRASLIGDVIADLPILNYLEEQYPGSYKYFYLHNKVKQIAPLFINHPLIDKIIVGEEGERLNEEELKIKNSCDIIIDEAPQHQNPEWYNTGRNMTQEGFFMRDLPYKFKYGEPKLERWFGKDQKWKYPIAIWPYAGYGQGLNRSPSKEWWQEFCIKLIEEKSDCDYDICHFGHSQEFDLIDKKHDYNDQYITRYTRLSFFEQIKLASSMVNITTDSGSGHVIGAYGCKQITLLTNWQPNHSSDFPYALAPENWAGLNQNLFAEGSCDNIPIEKVLELL